jgi:hypothetical protein
VDLSGFNIWTVEEFERAFPPLPKPNGGAQKGPGGATGAGVSIDEVDEADLPDDLLEWVHDGVPAGEDRSVVFFRVVRALKRLGYSAEAIFDLLDRYPNGIAQKYLDRKFSGSRARLRLEVRRAYDKPPKPRRPRAPPPPPAPPAAPPATSSPTPTTPPPVTPAPASPAIPSSPSVQPLIDAHATFRKWFGAEYDMTILDVVASAAAAERLGGDPLWLMLVAGSGGTKTETVRSLSGAGALIASTISSEGALLSATARSHGATGGLLYKLGARGLLVIKDFTSILSADRNVRGTVLAALREVHDGEWTRHVGFAGGRTLSWKGRIIVVAACTTAWDTAHAVIATMGDRFVIIRGDTTIGRGGAARQAIGNTGREDTMRTELAGAISVLVASADMGVRDLTEPEREQLIRFADIVTWARTGVERDYRGDVIDAHAREMPTRFAKQLAQLVRGALSLGMSAEVAMRLATRCAGDSLDPLRRDLLLDIAANPDSNPDEVRLRVARPLTTVKQNLMALHALRLLICEEREELRWRRTVTIPYYSLVPDLDRVTLLML